MTLGVEAIVESGLCIGCGLCRSLAGAERIDLVLTPEGRERPVVRTALDRPTLERINAVCPGLTATYPGAEAMGARPVEESAAGVVWAATLPDDGPRGGFFRDGQPLGW